ncbi:MAG: hypothetical protein ABI577_06415 [bacterium]
MDGALFLHAAHQVRQAFDGLRFASWVVIAVGLGALVVSWGRILTWIRTPEVRGPAVVRWGEDAAGWYFELARAGPGEWFVETGSGERVPLVALDGGKLLRPQVRFEGWPSALRSEGEILLRL